MPDRSCPACHRPVAAHQTLCPSCRTPVPSEPGPVARDGSAFAFSPPPPRQSPRPSEPEPEPVSEPEPAGPFVAASDATAVWAPGLDATTVAPWSQPGAHPVASAGVIGTPGAPVLDERGNRPGGLVGLLGAVLLAVGVFLPWIAVEGRDVSGWAASGDAKILLAVAVAAAVIAALLLAGARSLGLRLGLVGLGVVSLVLGVFEIVSASGIDDFAITLDLGLPLVLVSGAALVAAGVLTRHGRMRPGSSGPVRGAAR